jgi:dipeptidyl aminopeptidase/acylaminoacyl peptidase
MRYFLVFLTVLLLGQTNLPAQTLPPFSRLDVFELEWANNPQISPDGSKVIYQRSGMDIMQDQRMSRLWIMDTDGSNHSKLTSREVAETDAAWSPDGSKIAFVSKSENGSEIYLYWLSTSKIARLTQLPQSPSNLSWSPDGQQLAFSMKVPGQEKSFVSPPPKPEGATWADPPRITTRLKHEADGSGYIKPGFSHLFLLSAEGGTARQITRGDRNHGGKVQWTPDGKRLIFTANLDANWEYDYYNSEVYSLSLEDLSITALTDRKGPDHSPAISPDGKKIVYLSHEDKVQTYQIDRLYTMNLDGSGKKEIKTQLDRNPESPVWAPDGKGIYFQYDDQGNTKIGYTDLRGKTQVMAENLGGTSVGRPYSGGSFSVSDNGQIVYTHSTSYHPAELAIVGENGSSKLISSLNDDLLSHRQLGTVEELRYPSSFDGREIQGWIVKPPYYDESRSYPLIVENHGGPVSNYGDRFSPEMQLYASAGYVVFYPNPRGSTGYGEEFGNLLYHNYPGEDYQDVMDGVDVLVERGLVAEDSLFVTGGSAGGIMTAWIIGKNNRFRAAAVVKPVMNWISKTLVADNYFNYAHYRYPGQPWENVEDYWKFSPISLVGNIQTPTMVMVGTADMRTPLSEAKQLYHALKIRKIETVLVEIPGSYHFIAKRPSQLITKTDHIVAWFDQYR